MHFFCFSYYYQWSKHIQFVLFYVITADWFINKEKKRWKEINLDRRRRIRPRRVSRRKRGFHVSRRCSYSFGSQRRWWRGRRCWRFLIIFTKWHWRWPPWTILLLLLLPPPVRHLWPWFWQYRRILTRNQHIIKSIRRRKRGGDQIGALKPIVPLSLVDFFQSQWWFTSTWSKGKQRHSHGLFLIWSLRLYLISKYSSYIIG